MTMSNENVAESWARCEAAKGGNFYTDGVTLWSYGNHFPVAHHSPMGILITTRTYSVTTSRHTTMARRAARFQYHEVDNVLATSEAEHRSNAALMLLRTRSLFRQGLRAHSSHRDYAWRMALAVVETTAYVDAVRNRYGYDIEWERASRWLEWARDRVDARAAERRCRQWLRENRPTLYRKHKTAAEAWAADPGSHEAYRACVAMGVA